MVRGLIHLPPRAQFQQLFLVTLSQSINYLTFIIDVDRWQTEIKVFLTQAALVCFHTVHKLPQQQNQILIKISYLLSVSRN